MRRIVAQIIRRAAVAIARLLGTQVDIRRGVITASDEDGKVSVRVDKRTS